MIFALADAFADIIGQCVVTGFSASWMIIVVSFVIAAFIGEKMHV